MADNVGITTGVNATVASDDISSVQYQRVKITVGADGVNDGDVASGNPMPVGGAILGAVNESAPGTDTASSGLNGRLQRIAQRITSLIALLPTSLGQKSQAASFAVTLDSTQQTFLEDTVSNTSNTTAEANAIAVVSGLTTDAVVTTDTTGTLSSKLRGLVKWAYERMPASLGQKTMANSLAVTLASDQSAISITMAAGNYEYISVSGATVAATSSAYTAGDTVGTLLTLSNVTTTGKTAWLRTVVAQIVSASTAREFTILLFESSPVGSGSDFTDKDPMQIGSSYDELIIGKVTFSAADFSSLTGLGEKSYGAVNPDLLFAIPSGTTVYAAILADDALSVTANCLALRFAFEQAT